MLGARSIKPFERGRPCLRRTRALCKFNGGKVSVEIRRGCAAGHGRRHRERKEVTKAHDSREEKTRERRKTPFIERQRTERLRALTHARVSSWRGSFHAATVTRAGGERSWISVAVSLSMTFIGPPHFGQSQGSLESLLPDRFCSVCGAEPSR
jgi:hypothetical protein